MLKNGNDRLGIWILGKAMAESGVVYLGVLVLMGEVNAAMKGSAVTHRANVWMRDFMFAATSVLEDLQLERVARGS